MSHRYVVIMAGGTGTRLWPLSRASKPKQFLQLVGDTSLLQSTVAHITKVVPKERVFIMADSAKTKLAQEQLADHPKENFLIEPEARDNGPAIALATAEIIKRDQDALLAIFWSDHTIKNGEQFRRVIESSFVTAEAYPDHLISMGINPTYPATEFGYIKIGHEKKSPATEPVFTVDQFVEKPDQSTAEEYLRDWRYLWNTGYKVFRAGLMLELFATHQPAFYATLEEILAAAQAGRDYDNLYSQLEKKDIERLITEKTDKILVLPGDLGWSDIGAWNTVHDVLVEQSGQDIVVQSEGEHVGVNNERCLIIGKKKLIATVGLSDIVIIETDDALLVAHKSAAQDVKKVIEELKAKGKESYL